MTDLFSTGLASIMNDIQKSSGGNKELAEMIFKPVDGVKYISRILVEQSEIINFSEHNYVPVSFTKKSGEQVPGFSSFFCTKEPDCPVCRSKIIDKETGELRELKSRKVLAVPMFIKETRTNKRGKDFIEAVEEIKILILPPGRSGATWQQLLSSAEMRGTLKDRYYHISRTGKGMDTAWLITPDDKSDFEEKYTSEDSPLYVEAPDVAHTLKECGRWKAASEYEKLRVKYGEDSEEQYKIDASDEVTEQL